MSSQALSPVKAFLFSIRFVAANPGRILRRVAVPSILGIIALYLLLAGYLHLVSTYLEQPSGGGASRVLGVAALGVLVMLFLHSQLVSAVAGLLLEGARESFLGIRSHEWRLFVASLQLMLIICAYSCVFWPAAILAQLLMLSPFAKMGMNLFLLAVLYWIVVRAWFFLLPFCVSLNEGEMLPRAWTTSSGHFWKITSILMLVGVMVALFHAVLQLLLSLFAGVPSLPETISVAAALDVHRSLLLPFVLLVGGTYLPAAILTTVARIRLYLELTGTDTASHEG